MKAFNHLIIRTISKPQKQKIQTIEVPSKITGKTSEGNTNKIEINNYPKKKCVICPVSV